MHKNRATSMKFCLFYGKPKKFQQNLEEIVQKFRDVHTTIHISKIMTGKALKFKCANKIKSFPTTSIVEK